MNGHAEESHSELDTRLLRELGREPMLTLGELGRRLGVSPRTVARHLAALERRGVFRARARSSSALRGDHLWFLSMSVMPGRAEELAAGLAARPASSWVRVNRARTHVTSGWVNRGGGVDRTLSALAADPRVLRLRAHEALREWWHPEHGGLLRPQRPLDDVDRGILRALERDARQEAASLGRELGVDPTTVARRRKRLERERLMVVEAEFSADAPGRAAEALLWVRVAPGGIERMGRALAARPEAHFVAALSDFEGIVVDMTAQDDAAVLDFVDLHCADPAVSGVRIDPVGKVLKRRVPHGR